MERTLMIDRYYSRRRPGRRPGAAGIIYLFFFVLRFVSG